MNHRYVVRKNNYVGLMLPGRKAAVWMPAEDFALLLQELVVPDAKATEELEALLKLLEPMGKRGLISVEMLRNYLNARLAARKLLQGGR